MHVFYTPDIQKSNELPEEEAQHCIRVLRLSIGDEITLTDGKGNFYKAEITVATNKRCFVNIKETIFQEPLWPCHLHIAMAPPLLKNVLKPGEDALVLIGPEGDFSEEEVKKAIERGFVPISLGKSRLRTETAALVACHTLNLQNQ